MFPAHSCQTFLDIALNDHTRLRAVLRGNSKVNADYFILKDITSDALDLSVVTEVLPESNISGKSYCTGLPNGKPRHLELYN